MRNSMTNVSRPTVFRGLTCVARFRPRSPSCCARNAVIAVTLRCELASHALLLRFIARVCRELVRLALPRAVEERQRVDDGFSVGRWRDIGDDQPHSLTSQR
jgi:hypothetical protein